MWAESLYGGKELVPAVMNSRGELYNIVALNAMYHLLKNARFYVLHYKNNVKSYEFSIGRKKEKHIKGIRESYHN